MIGLMSNFIQLHKPTTFLRPKTGTTAKALWQGQLEVNTVFGRLSPEASFTV